MDAEAIVIGAGAAGLALADHLTRRPGGPSVLLIEPPPGPVSSPPRTWCFWGPTPQGLDEAVTASWRHMVIRGRTGDDTVMTCPQPYQMVRSRDYTTVLDTRLAERVHVSRLTATVTTVQDTPDGAQATGVDSTGHPFRAEARWVFDSRPPRRLPPARTTLLQHFTGWYLTADVDRFDPDAACLMDLRTPQPPRGLSFAYLLPFNSRQALVEYTEFSPAVLDAEGYRAALGHYVHGVLGLGEVTVTETEHGVIPMTDALFPRRAGRSVFRIGTAGGATRPATGYTFATIQRQSAQVAAAYRAGRTPVPPRPHRRRHRAMDAALLRALARGRLDGAAYFEDLFRRNSTDAVLRFLDGRSAPSEELAIGLKSPVPAMALSLAELPFLRRRHVSMPPPAAHRHTNTLGKARA